MKRIFNALVVLALVCGAYALGAAPRPGWVTPAEVVRVYDGDTVVVEVKKRFHVRLLDCWAPEVRTRDQAEKARGIAARDYLAELIDGREVLLEVPADGLEVGKSFSFGRLLGRIYIDDRDVGQVLVDAGHATKTK